MFSIANYGLLDPIKLFVIINFKIMKISKFNNMWIVCWLFKIVMTTAIKFSFILGNYSLQKRTQLSKVLKLKINNKKISKNFLVLLPSLKVQTSSWNLALHIRSQ